MSTPQAKEKRKSHLKNAVRQACKRRKRYVTTEASDLMVTYLDEYMEALWSQAALTAQVEHIVRIKKDHVQSAHENSQWNLDLIQRNKKEVDATGEEVASLSQEISALKEVWEQGLEQMNKRIDELSPPEEVQEHGTNGQSPSVTPYEAREQVLIRGLSPSVPPNEVWAQEFEHIDASVATLNE